MLNFEKSERLTEREKATPSYAEAITWRLDIDDAFWDRLYRHFCEPELVELGYFIAPTMSQQSWIRLLNIEHHEVLAGTAASMALGFETAGHLPRRRHLRSIGHAGQRAETRQRTAHPAGLPARSGSSR